LAAREAVVNDPHVLTLNLNRRDTLQAPRPFRILPACFCHKPSYLLRNNHQNSSSTRGIRICSFPFIPSPSFSLSSFLFPQKDRNFDLSCKGIKYRSRKKEEKARHLSGQAYLSLLYRRALSKQPLPKPSIPHRPLLSR